jgi:hypothetical protein
VFPTFDNYIGTVWSTANQITKGDF